MPLSRREVALAAVFARLQTLSATFPTILRFGNWTVPTAGLPSLVMEDGEDEVTATRSNSVHQIETIIRLEITVNVEEDAEIATTINEITADVQAAIGSDRTFDGVVEDCAFLASQGPFLDDRPGSPLTVTMLLAYRLRRSQSAKDPRAVV